MKNFFFGDNAKELLEGQWVSSEYGNPGISIETPKVLKRVDSEKYMPKEAFAMLKESQIFILEEPSAKFSISLSTMTHKSQDIQIDLNKAAEGTLQMMQVKGAQNMIVKQEEFSTKQGISGVKAYGTTTIVDPVSRQKNKMYYELLVFGQENGIQQVLIMHEDGSESGAELADRVLNSVELKVIQS